MKTRRLESPESPDADDRTGLREDFAHFDRNHDGRMEFGEFVQFLEALDAGLSRRELQIGFAEIDADRDGSIGFEEFHAWWID